MYTEVYSLEFGRENKMRENTFFLMYWYNLHDLSSKNLTVERNRIVQFKFTYKIKAAIFLAWHRSLQFQIDLQILLISALLEDLVYFHIYSSRLSTSYVARDFITTKFIR